MPAEIATLAQQFLRDPIRVAVTPSAATADAITQRVIMLDRGAKPAALTQLLADQAVVRALVFTRTKHGADRVVRGLNKDGIAAEAIHGNKSQSQREKAFGAFRQGRVRVLVATDIAARGIDVDGISHVVNFDLPNIAETYVHRIGRTARAGATGTAISFCSDADERGYLRDIEKLLGQRIPLTERGGVAPHRQASAQAPRPAAARPHAQKLPSRPQQQPRWPAVHRAPEKHSGDDELGGLDFLRPVRAQRSR
jgi:ATP-dependent RNA helicase RhlE